ncbi:MAG: hypothetical protein JNL11_14665 [Bdellovibrionaceae bacterium]|nr:hypothetical protein [Pseudobdellovibrionaceae bacterium]
MKACLKILLISILSVSSLAWAQTDDEEVVLVDRTKREIYDDSSEAQRLGRKYAVHYTLLGISPNFGPASNISAGYFIDRNRQVFIEIGSGDGVLTHSLTERSMGETRSMSSKIHVVQAGAHYKQFLGNSFYFRGGAHYQTVEYKYDLSNSLYESRREISTFKGESIVGSVAIGNQWQYKYLTIGCDWIGFAQPISYKIYSAQAPSKGSFVDLDQETFEEQKKNYVTGSSVIALRLYLGASF